MRLPLKTVTTAGILVGLAGCASTPPPTVQSGPDAEVTVDGLHRVDNSIMEFAYVKPGMSLQGYTKLMIDEVTVAYQKEPRSSRQSPGASEQNYALRSSQMDDLKSWFYEAVVNALTKDDGYEIVDAPGPDVLHVSAYLVDLVVRVPTETTGRQYMRTRSYGEVTLVLELHDSESNEILGRVADRRDPTRNTNNSLAIVSPTYVKADVERLFEYWANVLREGLDRVRELDPAMRQ
jgi:hypothetical protein